MNYSQRTDENTSFDDLLRVLEYRLYGAGQPVGEEERERLRRLVSVHEPPSEVQEAKSQQHAPISMSDTWRRTLIALVVACSVLIGFAGSMWVSGLGISSASTADDTVKPDESKWQAGTMVELGEYNNTKFWSASRVVGGPRCLLFRSADGDNGDVCSSVEGQPSSVFFEEVVQGGQKIVRKYTLDDEFLEIVVEIR